MTKLVFSVDRIRVQSANEGTKACTVGDVERGLPSPSATPPLPLPHPPLVLARGGEKQASLTCCVPGTFTVFLHLLFTLTWEVAMTPPYSKQGH